MEKVPKAPVFERDSGCPDGTEAEQREWLDRALVEVIGLAQALPYEPAPQHDLPVRPIHR